MGLKGLARRALINDGIFILHERGEDMGGWLGGWNNGIVSRSCLSVCPYCGVFLM
jgi:hypothetical protein